MYSLKNIIRNKDTRTQKVTSNICYMFLFKGGNILIGLLIIPLTINYVSSTNYGIWLTLSSIVAWMSFFDIGINNGLRNRYAECMAIGNIKKAQQYVSTTYAMLFMIFIPILIIFLGINTFINWKTVLNIQTNSDLNVIMGIVVAYFALNFILSTINIVVMANQEPAKASLITFSQQFFSLIAIYLLIIFTRGSLLYLCIALCVMPLIVLIFFNIFFYNKKYKHVCPRISMIDFSLIKDLFMLGYKFFFIQISALVLYQTTNFIIIRYYGANDVTAYNICYKYYGCLSMIFGILITPIWSSVTDAMACSDYSWVKRTVKKYLFVLCIFIFIGGIMYLAEPLIFKIWIGAKMPHIDFLLSLGTCLFIVTSLFSSLFVSVLNGAGFLKIQFYTSLFTPIVFIGLIFLFMHVLNMGVGSVAIAMMIANFSGIIIAPIQYYKIFVLHKKGLWVA